MANEFDFGSGNVALAVDVDFPSNVYAGPGIAISKTGAAWTVSLGYPPLSENIHVTPTNNYYLAVYDVAQALYEKVRLDNLISGATGLDTRTPMGDADYIALSTDRYIAIATPLTLNRTISLPPASSVPGGREVVIQDEIGTLGSSHALIVQPIGGDRIDGYSSRVIATPYGGIKLRSNGSNSWSFIATTSLTPVNDTNYTCNSDDKVVAYTALTAARTVTLPLAAGYAPGQRLTVMDQAGVCTASDTITVLPIGGDFINGLTASPALNAAHAFLGFVSNGANAWTVVDNVGGGGGSGSITASQITDASALGRLLITQATAALDRTSLGSGTTGDAMFLSNSPSAGRAVLGSGACGDNVFISVTQPAAQSALGLGTMATQNANNVAITGGTITGVTGIGGGASITMSDTAPGSPTSGSLWYDTAGGNLYVWYNDGTSSQWVVANNAGNAFLSLAGGTITGSLTVTGTTTVVTPAPGDNTTKAATTAFVGAALTAAAVPAPSGASPVMNGTAAPGVAATYSRGDHVHPVDTSRAAASALASYLPLGGGNMSGGINSTGGFYMPGQFGSNNGNITVSAGTPAGWSSGLFAVNPSGLGGFAVNMRSDTTSGYPAIITAGSNTVGSIFTNGSTTVYNTTSDARFKDNIRPLASELDVGTLIDAIEPVAFEWNIDFEGLDFSERRGHGFVAQDLFQVVPLAVTPGRPVDKTLKHSGTDTPWGVDFSKLVPYLVAEIQSLRRRVAELESRS